MAKFQPGQSGNPTGRPKALRAVEEAAREHTIAAMATLAAIMKDETQPGATRVRASELLLDRAWGKPRQPSELLGADGMAVTPALYTVVIS